MAAVTICGDFGAQKNKVCHGFHCFPFAAACKSLQSCPTLCDPIDGSPPGSTIPGILQARVLEWVAIAFSDCFPRIPNSYKERAGVKDVLGMLSQLL